LPSIVWGVNDASEITFLVASLIEPVISIS
jgi:hypothetical protein